LFAKNQKEIDAVHLAELKNKTEDLKQTLAAIEGEFKQKGKLTKVGNQKYYVRKGSFFNAFKYSEKINNVVRSKALGILDILEKLIPFIPNEVFKSTIEEFELVEYFPFHYYYSEFKAEAAYPASGFESTPISSLIGLCEGLDRPEVVRELQKPLYVALAYIFSRKKDSFSKSDFPELKPTVFDCAVDLALKNGWINEAEEATYIIIAKPNSIIIGCPSCNSDVNAYAEYCQKCGLHIFSMSSVYQKSAERDIPDDFLEIVSEKNDAKAFFYVNYPEVAESKVPYFEMPHGKKDLNKVLDFVLSEAVYSGLAGEIPDHRYYANCYTKLFKHLILHRKRYYKVSGNSIYDVQKKLKEILRLLEEKAQSYFHPHMSEGLRILENCFTPKLKNHPIFKIEREIADAAMSCPKCGSKMPYDAKYCGVCGTKLFERTNASCGQG
jgi:ribosomal protein L40E